MKRLIAIYIAVFLMLSGLAFNAYAAGDVVITWVAPVEYEDNSPLPLSEIVGYRVYYNIDGSTSYPNTIDVTDPTAVGHTMFNMPPATYYIVVTTLTDSAEANYSNVGIGIVDFLRAKPMVITVE